jgi:hypothetical protein
MLDELKRLLDSGKLPEGDRLAWMEALASSSLLPLLFEILRRSYKVSDELAEYDQMINETLIFAGSSPPASGWRAMS